MLSLLISASAVTFPLTGTAHAATPCTQEEVVNIAFISEDNTVPPTESSDLVVEAQNVSGEACVGVLLDYDDNEGQVPGTKSLCTPEATIVTNGACDRPTDENGRVTFTRGPRPVGTYRWQVWADKGVDNDKVDSGETLLGGSYAVPDGSPTGLNVTPENATNPVGTEHIVQARVIDGFNERVSGMAVDFEIIAGPNQNLVDGVSDLNCVTNDFGQCAVAYVDAAMRNGTDHICGYVDTDGDSVYDPAAGPEDGGNCDTEEPVGFEDTTDTVLKTWEGAAPPPACSDGADNDGDGKVDLDDPDCSGPGDDSEAGAKITTGPCAGMSYGETEAKSGGDGSFVAGTPQGDELVGTDGDDTFCAFTGNDTVDAGNGDDVVFAGGGADGILGGEGNDRLFGGSGKDTVLGGLGADKGEGGDGNDIVAGGLGRDSLKGNAGTDALKGKVGADTLVGGDGNDILKAGSGDDHLMGGPGADQLDGGSGRDTCSSGPGRDEVVRCER
ncbi:MAG: hypothetical protein H0V97_04260 [Actinobacteria bacterium]|nr:hypothetical protein [Actinomycetota bacterium]